MYKIGSGLFLYYHVYLQSVGRLVLFVVFIDDDEVNFLK